MKGHRERSLAALTALRIEELRGHRAEGLLIWEKDND